MRQIGLSGLSKTWKMYSGGILFGALCLIWGASPVASKISIETLPPLFTAGICTFFAGATLLLFVMIVNRRSLTISFSQFLHEALMGFLLISCATGLLMLSMTELSAGAAGILSSTVPIWIVLLRAVVGEHPTAGSIAGTILANVGILIIIFRGGESIGGSPLAVIMATGSALCWALGSLIISRRPITSHVTVGGGIQMAFGGILLILLSLFRGEFHQLYIEDISSRSIAALLYKFLIAELLAFVIYLWILGRLAIGVVASMDYVIPVITVLLGVVILQEKLSFAMVFGGGVVVAGIAILLAAERHRKGPAAEENFQVLVGPDATVGVTPSLKGKPGFGLGDIMAREHAELELISWITRRGSVSYSEIVEHMGGKESTTRVLLNKLMTEGSLQKLSANQELYGVRFAHRRSRLSDDIRQMLEDE